MLFSNELCVKLQVDMNDLGGALFPQHKLGKKGDFFISY